MNEALQTTPVKCTMCKGRGTIQFKSQNYRTVTCMVCKGRGTKATTA